MATMNIGYQEKHDLVGHMLTPSHLINKTEGVLGVLSMHTYPQSGLYSQKQTTDFGID